LFCLQQRTAGIQESKYRQFLQTRHKCILYYHNSSKAMAANSCRCDWNLYFPARIWVSDLIKMCRRSASDSEPQADGKTRYPSMSDAEGLNRRFQVQWWWVVSFTMQPLYHRESNMRYPGLGRPHRLHGHRNLVVQPVVSFLTDWATAALLQSTAAVPTAL
jgi:hypothetical protein